MDIYNANKSMIYKYSQKQVPDDSETGAAKTKKYKTISVIKEVSDSVLTTNSRLSSCSLQRDVNEVLLFHGTAVRANLCPLHDCTR